MLMKINRIKGLGLVFADFSWSSAAPTFRAVNLIYGWNGCGKTTLTQLFDLVASGAAGDIDYELEDDSGGKVCPGQAYHAPIRVFNQDYIDRNVRILESRANTISVLLGGENQELVTQIKTDEQLLNGDPGDSAKPGLIYEARLLIERRQKLEKDIESTFTEIAKTVGAAIIGSGGGSRTYRSPDAKRDFAALGDASALSEEAFDSAVLSLRQNLLPEIAPVISPTIDMDGVEVAAFNLINETYGQCKRLCETTVETKVIARLAAHQDVAQWVEEGTRLHVRHNSELCEYCGAPISSARVTELARHFSEADRQLKAEIDAAAAILGAIKDSLNRVVLPDPARLYDEWRPRMQKVTDSFNSAKAELITAIDAAIAALDTKKFRTNEPQLLTPVLDPRLAETWLSTANVTIASNNKKSREFEEQRQAAVSAIKSYYLRTVQADLTSKSNEAEELKLEIKKLEQEVTHIRERVAKTRAQISSTHRACETINANLRSFLGRDELLFEPEGNGETTGYQILRGGVPATRLSEGERTAIAFVYFVVHLGDGHFIPKEGIVVIDDPVSSLDSNSLYQAFSFLKNAVKDCKQVFVLTHSFELLRLLLNWRTHQGRRTSHYMIVNHLVDGKRRALINEMDEVLRTHETEYHYIFKQLKEMRAAQNGSIEKAYPVPNMARKLWETFLMFRVPNGQSTYSKMDILKSEGIDAQKLDAIYKFVNDQSHMTGSGFDPALVPETEKVLHTIFDVMAKAAPEHFKILDESTK